MKTKDLYSEIALCKTFCSFPKIKTAIYSKIQEEHFGTKLGLALWKYIVAHDMAGNLPPKSWGFIKIQLRRIEEDIFDAVAEFDSIKVSSSDRYIEGLFETLEYYKKLRIVVGELQKVKYDLENSETAQEVDRLALNISGLSTKVIETSADKAFFRLDLIDYLSYLKTAATNTDRHIIPTLFPSFDLISLGVSPGDLVSVAASSGGGKSAIIGLNQAYQFELMGQNVALASFEMSRDQLIHRKSSFISGIPLERIRSLDLTEEEANTLRVADRGYKQIVRNNGGKFFVFDPTASTVTASATMDETLLKCYHRGSRITIIDYINLLDRGKEDITPFLADASRKAKLFAKANNQVIYELAQLAEGSDNIKYSRAVEHNSDIIMIWNYPAKNRPGYIQIKLTKARQSRPYNFYLVEDFRIMRVYDLLDPIGLNILFSRATGKVFKKNMSSYFGMKKLMEQGVLTIDKLDRKDILDLVDQSIPSPSAPDADAVVDMTNEMINFIAPYNRDGIVKCIDNIKASELLAPWEKELEKIRYPKGRKTVVTQDKAKYVEKLEKEMANYANPTESTEDVVEREREVSETPKTKTNTKFDISAGTSQWHKLMRFYIANIARKQQAEIAQVLPDDIFESAGIEREIVTGGSLSDMMKHVSEIDEPTPPSFTTCKEQVLWGDREFSFRGMFDDDYVKNYMKNLNIATGHTVKEIHKYEKEFEAVSAEHLLNQSIVDNYAQREKMEANLVTASLECVTIKPTKVRYPAVTDITKRLTKSWRLGEFAKEGYDSIKAVEKLDLPHIIITPKFTRKQCNIVKNIKFKEKNSAYDFLFKYPAFEAITPKNWFLTVNDHFLSNIIKKHIFVNVYDETRDFLLNKVVWALLSPKLRKNTYLMCVLKHNLLRIVENTAKNVHFVNKIK